MYSTCLFCHGSLGRNQVIETFPVGETLAFDGEKGRLWAVCPQCRRWNLTPIEERWEAIETCERRFRALPVRSQTDEIGATRHPAGLRLIRIGKPLALEMATWRFGEALGQRMKRSVIYSGMLAAAGGLGFVTTAATGGMAGLAFWYGAQALSVSRNLWILKKGVLIPLPEGDVIKANPGKIDLLNPSEGAELGVRVKHKGEEFHLFGRDAVRIASKVLPIHNRMGARRSTVKEAVNMVSEAGGPRAFLDETWGKARPRPGAGIRWVMSNDMRGGAFAALPMPTRVGMEMTIQEEQERVALAGEMAALRAAWRQAEAIAQISDELLVSEETRAKLKTFKESRGDS